MADATSGRLPSASSRPAAANRLDGGDVEIETGGRDGCGFAVSIPAGGVRGEASGGAGEPAGVQRGDGVGDARGRAVGGYQNHAATGRRPRRGRCGRPGGGE